MPLPSTCLHHHLRQFTEAFRSCFSQPQFRALRDRAAWAASVPGTAYAHRDSPPGG